MKRSTRLVLPFLLLAAAAASASASPSRAGLEAAAGYSQRTGGDAFLVLEGDRVLIERYAPGQSATRPHLLASGSKSFACVLAAVAGADGRMSLDAPVSRYIREWRNDPAKSGITIRRLLDLSSGLSGGTPATVTGLRSASVASAIAAPVTARSGERFQYGPNPFLVFAEALARATGQAPDALLRTRVLDPIGAKVRFVRTVEDMPNLAGGAFMSARDWARFGALVRDGGVANGRRLVPEAGIEACFQPSPANAAYGMSWWLRTDATAQVGRRGTPATTATAVAPRPVRMAAGAFNQRLYVSRERNLVVVRFGKPGAPGADRFDDATLLRLLGL